MSEELNSVSLPESPITPEDDTPRTTLESDPPSVETAIESPAMNIDIPFIQMDSPGSIEDLLAASIILSQNDNADDTDNAIIIPSPNPETGGKKKGTPVYRSDILPPCRICGGTASGLHYGVNTCEACKGFFRRSLIKNMTYTCVNNKLKCSLNAGKRKTCPACRWKRCLEAGMSKDAIKTGRYTHQTRTTYIRELKENQQKTETSVESHGLTHQVTSSPGQSSVDVFHQSLLGASGGQDDPLTGFDICTTLLSERNNLDTASSSVLPTIPKIETFSPNYILYPSQSITAEGSSKKTEILDSIAQLLTSRVSVEVTQPNNDNNAFGNRTLEEETIQKKFMEEYNCREELFGKLEPIPLQEYQRIYNITGLDIDNRQEIVSNWTQMIEIFVQKTVKFAKMVPGFSDLSITDQCSLIKACRCEATFVASFHHFNIELNCKYSPMLDKKVIHKSEMKIIGMDYFIDEMFETAKYFQNLKLTRTERILLAAISIMASDRCILENPKDVEQVQMCLVESLNNYTKNNFPRDKCRFARILMSQLSLRKLSHHNDMALDQVMKLDWPQLQIPPLVYELFN